MEMRVMGRVEIFADGTSWSVQGRTQRALLSLLTLRLRVWTPAPFLVRALWPSDESDRALTRLHVQIHRLRRQLGGDIVNSSPNGYRLNVGEDGIDAWQFERAATEALDGRGAGAGDTTTLERLAEAASLWSGVPFPDVELPDVDLWKDALTDLYVRAQEVRSEILLDLGDSRTALSVLTPLAAEHPTNEKLQALKMSALQQAGKREELPRAFADAQGALAALGMEPGVELHAAHTHLLAAQDREDTIRQSLAIGDLAGPPADTNRCVPSPEDVTLRRELAYVLTAKGRHEDALSLLGHLEAVHLAHGQEDARAVALRDMVAVVGLTGDLRRALRLLGEAMRLDERTTGTDALLQTVRALILTHMGRLRRAEECLDIAGPPRTAKDHDSRRDQLWWRARSQIDRRAGRHSVAVPEAHEASLIAASADPDAAHGPATLDVACCLRDAGDEECFSWYRTVIRFAYDAGRFPLAACAHASAAKAHLLWGDPQTAAVHARTALDLAQRCGCWLFAARAAARLADAEEQLGNPGPARWYRYEALASYRRVDFPLADDVRARLEGRADAAAAGFPG
ncbi:BTAD domain-containing putative transcriptional regulator [Brevibacterium yomogidense]|uniref:BTAD domain-containing putative transcriptional regulator n=1 Tax=Brevibacterium yomogidense TaxID=946573 RepID=UPI0018DF0ACA|nr:BTAD domain-containing putative transcriptional regulator [Brevibacterium yomogidense]